MEQSFSKMSLLLLQIPYFFLILLFILVILWNKSTARSVKSKCPPGPWKLPIIGNLHQLAGNPLPHQPLRELANKHGPVMQLKLGQLEFIVISSSKAAQEVLKTHELTFAQRPSVWAVEVMTFGKGSMFFAPYGDFWRELRKVSVMELFSAKRVQSFRSIRQEEVSDLVQSIYSSSSSSINFSKKISTLINGIVSQAALGIKYKDLGEFMPLLEEIIKVAAGFGIPDLFPSLGFLGYVTGTIPAMKKMRCKMAMILDSVIDNINIKSHAGNGIDKREKVFVDVILRLLESDKLEFNLTKDHIKDIIMEIFSAGSETSSTTTEWIMAELMRNPRVMKKAQAEVRQVLAGKSIIEEADLQKLEYLKAVVKESLRLHPPATLLPRESRDVCKIGGYEFPMNTKVIINEWAIGRDPDSWDDPESFKPERFLQLSHSSNADFTPFGDGRRKCPGMLFGLSMIEHALSQLLYHFDWELAHGIKPEELDMAEEFGITCKRKHDLYLIATPH